MYLKSGVAALAFVILLSGCSNTPSKQDPNKKDFASLIRQSGSERDKYLRDGLTKLQAGNYEGATVAFNIALNKNPFDSLSHTLTGISEHMRAVQGDGDRYAMAEQAYKAAILNDSGNRIAPMQLARLYFEGRQFAQAQEMYAKALMFEPQNPDLLYGLAASSYQVRDIETALKTIRKAEEVAPNDQRILQTAAMIHGASGDKTIAEEYYTRLAKVADKKLLSSVRRRLSDWERIHEGDRFVQLAALKDGPVEVAPPPANMAIVDVIIMRTEESAQTQSGQNIFKQLQATIGNPLDTTGANRPKWSKTENKTRNNALNAAPLGAPLSFIGTFPHTESYTIMKEIGLQAFNYSLQLANAENSSSEVVARPTLVALDQKPSSFFSGNQLVVGLTGSIGGGQLDHEKVGVHLEFTPKFLKDGRIEFNIAAGRSFPEANLDGGIFKIRTQNPNGTFVNGDSNVFDTTFQMAVNEITANVVMEFGQTLILGGLSERELIRKKEGFPILKDIPVLQYFFAEDVKQDFLKSIVILMTPRKPGFRSSNQDPSDPADHPTRHLDRFMLSYVGDVPVKPNMKHIFAGLESNAFYSEFRIGDVNKDRWFHTKDRDYLIGQTLDMLYF
jgi:tetratricopeptide (TPR) repeat protein